jgi:hypothetical protein
MLYHLILYRPRICELEDVWVDQRTLSLSMSPGGWVHPYVMDYFGILSNMAQYHREKQGAVNKKDILMHIVIKEDAVCNNTFVFSI